MIPPVEATPAGMPVAVGGVGIGHGCPLRVIAGPCSVESADQLHETAAAVRAEGVTMLRGGAFKPRTSPYSFQGLGRDALVIMRAVADDLGMLVVTEALAVEDVALVAEFADMVQIGARNMDNDALLRRAAGSGLPILLKRGPTSTVDELLRAADVVLGEGNDQVVLCERGSRTFEPSTRNSLDIAAVPDIQQRSELPVIVDPSHGTGRADLVTDVALAGIAAGADGVMVEVHPDPERALSDGDQSLSTDGFAGFMQKVRAMAMAVGRAV